MSRLMKNMYSYTLIIPALIIYLVLFIVPTIVSFFFAMTRWTLIDWEFIGFENFVMFFQESSLMIGFKNTLIYGVVTMGLKVVFSVIFAVFLSQKLRTTSYLRATIFFPTLVSTIAVGITFTSLMHPSKGLINDLLSFIGISGPDWLGNPDLALISVALVDVWKGVGIATVIVIAGIMSIPQEYYEAAEIDGASKIQSFWRITLPLARPAINIVIVLAMIGGLRTFDLIWAMTGGGPGFSSDLIASIIYKQYQAGFYGLATAGNVIMFIIIAVVVFPLYLFVNRKEAEL